MRTIKNNDNLAIPYIESREPIITFDNKDQFIECTNYWRNMLPLEGWALVFELKYSPWADLDTWGDCSVNYTKKCASIRILNDSDGVDSPTFPVKFCAERTLVHELLHCVIDPLLEGAPGTVEAKFFVDTFHQIVDSMSVSLLCVRYPEIDKEWFMKDGSEI